MFPARLVELFDGRSAKIEEGINQEDLAIALELLELVFFEKSLLKFLNSNLQWKDLNLMHLQIMLQTNTSGVFVYVAYQNENFSNSATKERLKPYFDQLQEERGWPQITAEPGRGFSDVLSIRIANVVESKFLAILGPKPEYRHYDSPGLKQSDRRHIIRMLENKGDECPSWVFETFTRTDDGSYQFWNDEDQALYKALKSFSSSCSPVSGAEPTEKKPSSPSFKPSNAFIRELLERKVSFEVAALAAALGDVGLTLEMLETGKPTSYYPDIDQPRKPQKEKMDISEEEQPPQEKTPNQEQQAILDCLDCWYPKTEGCLVKLKEKLRTGQIAHDRSALFYAMSPDSVYCHKRCLDQDFPHEGFEMIANNEKDKIVLTSDDLFYIVERVKPTYKTYKWIFTKVKPTKQHVWAMLRAIKNEITVYKRSSISHVIEACTEKFTDEEIDSFYLDYGLTNHDYCTVSNLGYTMTQKLYDHALRTPELHRIIVGMFWHEEKEYNNKQWSQTIEEYEQKTSCLRNIKIKPEDLTILLSFPKYKEDQTSWVPFMVPHIFTLCPEMKTTKEHLRLCLQNGFALNLYFALAQRLEDRVTIRELSHAVDHYRENKSNKSGENHNLQVKRRYRTGEVKPREEPSYFQQVIFVRE